MYSQPKQTTNSIINIDQLIIAIENCVKVYRSQKNTKSANFKGGAKSTSDTEDKSDSEDKSNTSSINPIPKRLDQIEDALYKIRTLSEPKKTKKGLQLALILVNKDKNEYEEDDEFVKFCIIYIGLSGVFDPKEFNEKYKHLEGFKDASRLKDVIVELICKQDKEHKIELNLESFLATLRKERHLPKATPIKLSHQKDEKTKTLKRSTKQKTGRFNEETCYDNDKLLQAVLVGLRNYREEQSFGFFSSSGETGRQRVEKCLQFLNVHPEIPSTFKTEILLKAIFSTSGKHLQQYIIDQVIANGTFKPDYVTNKMLFDNTHSKTYKTLSAFYSEYFKNLKFFNPKLISAYGDLVGKLSTREWGFKETLTNSEFKNNPLSFKNKIP